MVYKNKVLQQQTRHSWYLRNKGLVRERSRNSKIERKKWFETIKLQYSCSRCPENHISCIEFHHKNQKDKLDNISRLIRDNKPKHIILAEIKKCIPLCTNCHRKEHSNIDSVSRNVILSRKFKEQYKCETCNEDYYACLDFHHLNPNTKLYSINELLMSKKIRLAEEEVKKCKCLCGNCHKKLHYTLL